MGLLAVVCSPQSFNRDLVRLSRRIFRTSLKGDARNENKTPQSIQCHEVSKMGSPATSPARSDARVQHVGLQFGNGSGKHLRFVSAARRSGYEKKNTSSVFCAPRQSPSLNPIGRQKADKATAKAPYDWFSSPHKRRRCVSRRHAIANRAGLKLRRRLLREPLKLRIVAQ
jgi:hypothetical protein